MAGLQLLGRALHEFGIPDEVVSTDEVGRAWSNRLWSVRTSQGRYAIKELLNPWGDPLWRAWLEEAIAFERAAIGAGVRSPCPLLTAAGDALVDVGGRTFRAHEWITGSCPCPPAPVTASVAAAVAQDLARMHALQSVPARDDVFPTTTTATSVGWPELVAQLREIGSPYATAVAQIAPEVATIRAWFDRRPDGRRVMSHGDVDQKNLLLAGGNPWLVDWDVAAPWLPAEEAMRTAMSLADWTDRRVVGTFLSAYFRAGGEAFEPDAALLARDLQIGLDWLDRCLRIASGLQPADQQRIAEARAQATVHVHQLPARVAIATDLPRWSTKPHDARQSHTFGA
ncbi:phosphotransferase family protein [Flexivirga sp. B27]